MIIFSSFIMLSSCPAIPAGENYILNPGFEEGGAVPDNWISFSLAAPEVSFFWDSTVSYQGEKSVSIESGERSIGMWRQVVPASGGTVYTLAGCLNLENVSGAGYCTLQVVFRDSANRLLEMVDFRKHRGTIEWINDFPYSIYTVAPESTTRAEVNLVLQGPGKAWFDTVHFGPAETGIISGRAIGGNNPIEGARVFIWGTDYESYTDEDGYYTIHDIPVSAPRYLIYVTREGYRDTAHGDIDIREGDTTTVNLEMERGSNYPHPELRVKFASLRYRDSVPVPSVPSGAVIEPGLYPDSVMPYLQPDEYIDSDHPSIQQAVNEIISSLDPADRTDTRAVSYAIYLRVITNYECDATSRTGEFIDTTSGGWQTISGEGWCWGHNFLDWLYKPSEMFEERRGICIEHSRFITSLLRAAGIPARPVKQYSAQFWAQTAGGGQWIGINTMGGRSSYRSTGSLYAGYESSSPSEIFNYAIDSGPIIHSDWYTQSKCMWREVHPWEETYSPTGEGYDQAVADLEIFAESGEAPDPPPPPPAGSSHILHYSDFTLKLATIGQQRRLVARFPFPVENQHVDYLDRCAYWTDHPECVVQTRTEETANPATGESAGWFNIEFDLSSLVTHPAACDSGDYDGDGRTDIAVFRDTTGLWAIRDVTRCYFGTIGDIPVSGDYDGDNTAEIGIFREDAGLWAIRGATRLHFGTAGDCPVPGDYSGDGTCDPAIFRSSSGLWAIRTLTRTYFGEGADAPVGSDYDGDGTEDVAVFRPSTGLWAIRGISRLYFGRSFDIAVPGDYDGDEFDDPAIFRPDTGLWAVRGVSRFYFGAAADTPLRGDYDGSGHDSIAIFRGSSGLWAISSVSRCYFGTAGDLPVTR